MHEHSSFLLYGANGYTAGLIIAAAQRYGLRPILAGRNQQKISSLAQEHGLPYRIGALDDSAAVDALLRDVEVVLHCAGPFSKTAWPMQQACLRTGTHYLDITGEIAVFEKAASLHTQAVKQNIMLMPGVGFDVVPTDCLALHLKQQLADATHLQLAFATPGGQVSHGTAATAAENLGVGGVVRENGKLRRVRSAHKTLRVPFTDKKETLCMAVPWGDVATAWYTTNIPNIETFMAVAPSVVRAAKWSNYLGWIISSSWFKKLVKQRIDRNITGPADHVRKKARSFVYGRVWNEKGAMAAARMEGPDGYTLTAETALLITRKVLNGEWRAGYQTPAGVYGPNLVLEVEGTQRWDLHRQE